MCFSCGCCHPCAILQCQMFEEAIISDRAEKKAKRRQLEQDALELKSILKVKGSKAEAVLFHQQLGANHLHHRFVRAENGPGVGWHKQRTDEACPFLLGQTQSQQLAAGLRRDRKGRSQSPRVVWGHAHHTSPTAWAIQGGSRSSSPACPLATSSRCPRSRHGYLQCNQHRPNRCCVGQEFPPAAGEHRRDALAIELYQVPQQVISS